tara:strand:+ start:1874 stop:2116 length:243 start_codon:yes stop_codon:yes gene_type:complete
LKAHGIGLGEFTYLRKDLNLTTKTVAHEMLEAGEIIQISIEGIEYYCKLNYIEKLIRHCQTLCSEFYRHSIIWLFNKTPA